MYGHPRDQAKVSVHCRWPLIRGNLTLKCVGRGIDNVAVHGRWPLTTGVAQGRYYSGAGGGGGFPKVTGAGEKVFVFDSE